ncbi:AfsR/SARP family transcriptional regulator [Plantactinospora soyae]|uniref:DNA-binding SARP family transcriptional activator n=1 Tax=Plantactinospora soyae TaxID=1544732 RepID=A0A927ME61_9ACTN|nr:BTAD domain-containing putative transcriptional regulator [Plantactinospora soyae]MBE1491456.1 DNA-binding SARP family transcriptional activator [Plantactinospora soyae]
MSLRYQLLGPLRIDDGRRSVPIGPQKPRVMLAMLLLSTNERVSLDRLVTELWERPPRSAVANLRTYASGLRRLLGDLDGTPDGGKRLLTNASGYLLRIDPEELDVHHFRVGGERGRSALADGDFGTAISRFRAALRLWRGRPAEDVRPGPDLAARLTLLDEQYLTIVEDLMEARLAVGEHGAVPAELRLLIAAHPFRERLRRQLMLALYRCGDAPAALRVYTETRATFADQLGLEPGAELSRLHVAILRRAPELSPPQPPSRTDVVGVPAPVGVVVAAPDGVAAPAGVPAARGPRREPAEPPRQLPAEPVAFVGRTQELATIARLQEAAATARPQPRTIVLHGPGGIGKTTLAVRVAHLLADRFPDGQLYLELHGGGGGLPRVDPLHALGRLLRALGLPAAAVPTELTEAAALFRSVTATRRLLVVLDGAAGVQQVRSLLPAGAGCLVIVTCRRPMSTLWAARLRLGQLSVAEGVELLDLLAGDDRAVADPVAAARLVALCDGHPLALRIAGARLAARPDWPLAVLSDRLDNERVRLDELRADDLAIRSSFGETYRELSDGPNPDDRAAAAAFRLMALLRIPEIPSPLAAVLIGTSQRRALTLLDRLAETHLLEAVEPTRFRFHGLLRLYAEELAEETDPAADRRSAVRRALTAYLTTAIRAGQLLRPHRSDRPVDPPVLAQLQTIDDALPWLERELLGLLAAVGQAFDAGPELARLCVQLMPPVAGWLQKGGRWAEADTLVAVAEKAASIVDDPAEQARVRIMRATLHWHAGRPEQARAELESVLRTWRRLGDREGEGRALQALGWFHHRTGDLSGAAALIGAAVEILAEGYPGWLAVALHNLAEVEFERCDYQAARRHLDRSLTMRREQDDPAGEAITLVALGRTYSQLGRHSEGLAALTAGLRLCRRTGNREDEWEALLSRSEVHLRLGDAQRAQPDVEEALALVREIGDSYGEAAAVRQRGRVLGRLGWDARARECGVLAQGLLDHLPRRRDGVLETFLVRPGQPTEVDVDVPSGRYPSACMPNRSA